MRHQTRLRILALPHLKLLRSDYRSVQESKSARLAGTSHPLRHTPGQFDAERGDCECEQDPAQARALGLRNERCESFDPDYRYERCLSRPIKTMAFDDDPHRREDT